MPDGPDHFTVDVVERLADVDRAAWEACAGGDNPFISYDFLNSLEISRSVGQGTGWAPRHLLVREGTGQILACMPLYLKGNSHGEYIFDWAWAEAFERAGGQYYPKLLSAVPFTPVTAPKLLIADAVPQALRSTLHHHIAQTLVQLCKQAHLSSIHVNFVSQDEAKGLDEFGFLHRLGIQFHWPNDNYATFDDFLGRLTSRKRKAIKKERRQALEDGAITLERLSGSDIRPKHWDALYRFYLDTGAKKWGQAYLNREFFDLIGATMADRIVLVMAKRGETYIAGALNLIGTEALYGRYWGCSEDVRYLHFEVCYYQAIEIAIERGLKRVEAGAQGEHKIARGYLPTLTHSAHFIADAGFREAISDFLDKERQGVKNQKRALLEESPYRKEDISE